MISKLQDLKNLASPSKARHFRKPPWTSRPPVHFEAASGRNHNGACFGCIVPCTTETSSSPTRSRSVSSLSLAEKASRVFARRGYRVEVVDMTNGSVACPTLKQLKQSAYRETIPYVFVDHRPVGGFGIIKALDYSGDLERLVRGEI